MEARQASEMVSIVVGPRERFSRAIPSIDDIYANTTPGFELVYVDAGSPPHVQRQLQERAERHKFRLVRNERMLAPNVARNIGLSLATRKYVVFIDNDIMVKPDWLVRLVECAEETGAGVVGPLYLQGPFEENMVHMAGGLWDVEERDGKGWPVDMHVATNHPMHLVADLLFRQEVAFVEFHCVLVRRRLLRRLGGLDERMLSTPEHVDLALAVRQTGASVYIEPRSVITYYMPDDLDLFDLSYFALRWSNDWNTASLRDFAAKWNYHPDAHFLAWQRDWTYKCSRRYGIALMPSDVARRALPAISAAIAQTDAALYRQMASEDYAPSDIDLVKQAYEVGQILFGTAFRPNGRPFLAHAVGTASVVAHYRQPAHLLAAAILHAAYGHGAFPAEVSEDGRRDWLAGKVGRDVEQLVFAYRSIQLMTDSPRSSEELATVQARMAVAVVLAIANDIDDSLDGARSPSQIAAPENEDRREFYKIVANILHLPGLGRSFEMAMQNEGNVAVAPTGHSPAETGYRLGPDGQRVTMA